MAPKDTPEIARQRDERFRRTSAEHLRRYLATNGEDGYYEPSGMTNLILTTTGRRSGKPYSTPLYFGEDAGRYVLIGSYAGSDKHPQWYLNLVADPNVTVQIRGERFAARARTARGEERERLWRMMAARFPRYEEYRQATERE